MKAKLSLFLLLSVLALAATAQKINPTTQLKRPGELVTPANNALNIADQFLITNSTGYPIYRPATYLDGVLMDEVIEASGVPSAAPTSRQGGVYRNTATGILYTWNGTIWRPIQVPDGNYGEITVTSGGQIWGINTNVVTNLELNDMPANTVKGNNTGSSADPTDIFIGQNQLFGRGSTGNLAPISLGNGLGFTGTTLNPIATNGATVYAGGTGLGGTLTQAITTVQGTGDNRFRLREARDIFLQSKKTFSPGGAVTEANLYLNPNLTVGYSEAVLSSVLRSSGDSAYVRVKTLPIGEVEIGSRFAGGGLTYFNFSQLGVTTNMLKRYNSGGADSIVYHNPTTGELYLAPAASGGLSSVSTTARFTGNGTGGSPLELAQQSATSGQVLKWNGTAWVPAADNIGVADGNYGEITVTSGGQIFGLNPNVVTNLELNDVPANTVKGNDTGSSADPTDIFIGQNQLFGRGSTGNLAPITLGDNLSFTGTTLNATGGSGGGDLSVESDNTLIVYQVATGTPTVSASRTGGTQTITATGGTIKLKSVATKGVTADLAGDNSFKILCNGVFGTAQLAYPVVAKWNLSNMAPSDAVPHIQDTDNTPQVQVTAGTAGTSVTVRVINLNAFTDWVVKMVW